MKGSSTSDLDVETQLVHLVQASSALLSRSDPGKALRTIFELAASFVTADAYAVWRMQAESRWVRVASLGLSDQYEKVAFSESAIGPLPEDIFSIEDLQSHPLVARRHEMYRAEGLRSMLTIPLLIHGERTGTLVFYYRSPHQFSAAEKTLAGALGHLAGAALSTAELCASQIEMRAAAEAAESRAAFLAKAGEALAASLDYETTLETVAELAVPDFADWCGVDLLLKNGEIKRLAVKHFNPAKIAFMRELIEKYPPGEADAGRIAISTGNSLLMSEITEGLITARARDAEHARLILELGLKSFIVVPLVAPGRVFGALTFATAESQRTYTAADLQLAEDLARRAATAIDNAQLHREVRDNEERLRLAIDAGKIGAWDWDVRNDHVEWSDRVYEMHGVAPGTFGGKVQDFSKLIHPDDLQMVESAIRNSLERGEPYDLEFRVIHHTGEVRWLTTSARVIYDEQGRPVRMLGATMDTTDRRRAEEVAEKQAEALARSNSELQQFAFAASHDLQEPLRMVRIFGQLLSRQYKGKLDSQADQFLEQIESGTERMANLIQDLLAYSQVLHGEPAVTLVDCNEVLAVVLQSCRASIEESGALIEAGPLPTIPAEKLQLVQLFQNLLSNAIKYRKLNEAPRIRIDARETPKEWLLCFADNGIGIAAEHQDRIFAVFARLGGNESGGTGLGLAICERIVKRREGRIWVESEPGVGSRFYVALPRSVSAPV